MRKANFKVRKLSIFRPPSTAFLSISLSGITLECNGTSGGPKFLNAASSQRQKHQCGGKLTTNRRNDFT